MFLIFLVFSVFSVFSVKAGAVPLEQKSTKIIEKPLSAKSYLTAKLDFLVQSLPESHPSRNPLLLRLAHVLSLRAEEKFIKADKGDCPSCSLSARNMANKALLAYKKLDPILHSHHPLLYTEALFKQAYLLSFLNEPLRSLSALKKISTGSRPLLKARVWFNMGEIHFEMDNYKASLQAFDKVLKQGESPWSFKATYQKIWSLFNLSLYELAVNELELFLKSKLYSQPRLTKADKNLKQKLESELVALYSYAEVRGPRLSFLYNFSKHSKESNSLTEKNLRLFQLANSLSQMGRRAESNIVYQVYLSKSLSLKDQMQAYLAMLDNDYRGQKDNYLKTVGRKVEKLFVLRQQIKISKKFDLQLKNRVQKTLQSFNRYLLGFSDSEKSYLLSLFQKYNSVYPNSADMLFLSAHLAKDLKKYALAQSLFQAVVLNADSYEAKDISKKELKESLSLLQMEMAEQTQNLKKRINAYDFYIQNGSRRGRIWKAMYQKAYINYERKEYKKSAYSFMDLVLSSKTGLAGKDIKKLRLKSAHLALSALDHRGGEEEELARLSGIFMKEFPKNRPEFVRIYHSALLNTVKKLVSKKDFSQPVYKASSDKNILKAWSVLEDFSIKEAKGEEALSYYFNRLILAKELLKFKPMDKSIQFLLSNKALSKEDRKTVLKWKLWLAELRLDFKEALKIVQEIETTKPSEEQILRLSRLAELSGESPVPYYSAFIKKFPNSSSLLAVLTSLVEKSLHKNRKQVLIKHAQFFKNQPETLTHLVLKIDEGQLDNQFMKAFTSLNFMKNSSLNLFLRRKNTIELFESQLAKLAQLSLPPHLEGRKLNRKLKNYTKQIELLKSHASSALKTKDWTVRVFVISKWRNEISRFYNSVMSLSLPPGLTEQEQNQYKGLLSERMKIYKVHIVQLEEELEGLWSRDFLKDYKKAFQHKVFHGPLKWEIEKVLTVLDGEPAKQAQSLLHYVKTPDPEQKTATASSHSTQHLYKALKENPFDRSSLNELLKLEKDNEVLSYYLANRIKELKKQNRWIKL